MNIFSGQKLFAPQYCVEVTMSLLIVLGALLGSLASVSAVDRSKFRVCQDASFCRRHREVDSEPEVRSLLCEFVATSTPRRLPFHPPSTSPPRPVPRCGE